MSEVDTYIANLALGCIGQDEITSIDEDSKPARTCKAHYNHAIDLTLEAYDWAFARQYVVGNVVASDNYPLGASFAYALPAEAVAVRGIQRLSPGEPDTRFSLGMNEAGDGRVIYTAREAAVFIVTARPASSSMYPPSFKEAAGWALARLIVMPILKDLKTKDYCEKGFIRAIGAAATLSANSEIEDNILMNTDPDWIRDRGEYPVSLPPVAK